VFDAFKNMSGLAGLMKNAGQMREQFEQFREEAKAIRVTAETGGGVVRATASGAMRIVSIEIDPTMFAGLVSATEDQDRQLAEDLIAGAVNAALEKAQQQVTEELSRRASEMGISLPPGMDLGNLLT